MMRRPVGAAQFLTVLPVPGRGAPAGESAVFFPVAGALLGAICGGLYGSLGRFFGAQLAALAAIAALVAITGGLHEDGLADVADAIRAGRTRERMLAILKDSRIGTFGGLALVFSVALRWQCLARVEAHPVAGVAAALALSRASMVALAGISAPLGEGLGADFVRTCSPFTVAVSAAQAVAFAWLAGPARGGAMVLSTALIVFAARRWFTKRLGGVNGDCLGATCQAVETVNLAILAWRSSI